MGPVKPRDRTTSPATSLESRTRRIGEFEVVALSDGILESSLDLVLGIDRSEAERLTGVTGDAPVSLTVNAYLIRHAETLVLVDTGAGDTMGPSLGFLVKDLQSIGVSPDAIDSVLLTHLHPDHSNGLVDASDRPFFPNAELVVHEREANFWLAAEPEDMPERLRRNTIASRRTTAPYRERMRTVKDGEGLPGISAVLQAGHTPGHTGWLLESGGDAVLIWGDLVHLPAVQVPRPDAALMYDVDPEAAVLARRRVLDWVANDRLRVAGAHLAFPGFGYVRRNGPNYSIEPAE